MNKKKSISTFTIFRFGRKRCFAISLILYIVFGFGSAFAHTYTLFLITRVMIGISGSGVYEAGYTLLSELTVKGLRTSLGIVYNLSYAVGMLILPIFALISPTWTKLQLYMAIPTLLLLINCWVLPESPRWLMSQGRRKEALKVLKEKETPQMEELQQMNGASKTSDDNRVETASVEDNRTRWQKFKDSSMKLLTLIINSELRNRVIICWIGWLTASLSYFVISLNGSNFGANLYVYTALNGVAEAPGYIVPLFILAKFGRKITSTVLFTIAGLSLLVIMAVPTEYTIAVMIVALFGRFAMCAVFAVIILQTSELFPTINRNTAIGTSLTIAQLGSIIAPYIVELGKYNSFIPSTICGILSILTSLLLLLLPETKDKPLLDTMEDLKNTPAESRVSFMNCFNFK